MLVRKRVAAFTLIEFLLVLGIIGVLLRFAPRLIRRSPNIEWSHVLDEMNNLIRFTRQEAISRQSVYRLVFNASRKNEHSIYVEREEDDPEKPGMKHFVPVFSDYFNPTYSLPEMLKIDAVYLGKREQLAEQKQQAYCYVIHNGLVQDVIVHMRRFENNQESWASFTVEPFLGVFSYHDGRVKP